jgi:hypothetical protein
MDIFYEGEEFEEEEFEEEEEEKDEESQDEFLHRPEQALKVVEEKVMVANFAQDGFVCGEVMTARIALCQKATVENLFPENLRHVESMNDTTEWEENLRKNSKLRKGINDLGDMGVNIVDHLCEIEFSDKQEQMTPKAVWLAIQKVTSESFLCQCMCATLFFLIFFPQPTIPLSGTKSLLMLIMTRNLWTLWARI